MEDPEAGPGPLLDLFPAAQGAEIAAVEAAAADPGPRPAVRSAEEASAGVHREESAPAGTQRKVVPAG
jgi:hypothetical protein